MTYNQTISYLYSLLPVFHRIGAKAFKADLQNILAISEHLGNPHLKFKSIHVAGTNGKGSTSHFMASILQEAGYKVGLHTSPHLKNFTERFRINGVAIDEQNVVDFVEEHKEFIEKLKPSFFELSVGLAFQYFAQEAVDIAVIEVGLGGRLDSTNIITPELSIITNIDFDHMDILGDTRAKIAFEKAGIIKPNVPVVISEKHLETEQVFREKAQAEEATIFFAEETYQLQKGRVGADSQVVIIENNIKLLSLESGLRGTYQAKNIVGVLEACRVLNQRNWNISEANIIKGIRDVVKNTQLKGRWQILQQNPYVICDTGHNVAGIREVLQGISEQNYSKLYMIIGFVADKDISSILSVLPTSAKYYFCQADTPRALSAFDLQKLAATHGLDGEAIADVNHALQKALEEASPSDLIFIGGSTFVVAGLDNL
jgi:dihydrofolate synthase / folylpolyglutamate synthase